MLGSAASLHGLAGVPRAVGAPDSPCRPGWSAASATASTSTSGTSPESRRSRSIDGLRVTSLARTVADVCRLLPRFVAVCVRRFRSSTQGCSTPPTSMASPGVRHLMARRRNCVAGRRHLSEASALGRAVAAGDPGAPAGVPTPGLRPTYCRSRCYSPGGVLLGFGDMGYRLPSGGLARSSRPTAAVSTSSPRPCCTTDGVRTPSSPCRASRCSASPGTTPGMRAVHPGCPPPDPDAHRDGARTEASTLRLRADLRGPRRGANLKLGGVGGHRQTPARTACSRTFCSRPMAIQVAIIDVPPADTIGQRDARDRHDAQRHADVLEHLERQPGDDAGRHEPSVQVVGAVGDHDGPPQHDAQERR